MARQWHYLSSTNNTQLLNLSGLCLDQCWPARAEAAALVAHEALGNAPRDSRGEHVDEIVFEEKCPNEARNSTFAE